MKDKLKNLMKNKLFIGSVAGVLALAIVITVILCLPGKQAAPVDEGTSQTSTTDTVPDIETPDTTDTTSAEKTEDLPSDISVEVGENTGDKNADVETGGKAENPAAPVNEAAPEKPDTGDNGGNSGGGIQIGNPPVEETYSCGCANHHCQNADYHAALLNRELDGCPYCGSHSCPSFYATDEWGYTTLDITKCPKYSVKSDPLHYCQDCGKKPGDGSNGTCAQFLHACNCPNCGEWVEANTCHTCK
ncbi:MAG: hypothetical protein PHV32_05925 [Eubacteriales bacterium]|nr:hypothetical protein [Eubacteriales bacterium]